MSLPTVYYLHHSVMSSVSYNGKRKKGGYKMPPKIPTGEVLTDSCRKDWVILSSIARGGFGEIYTASALNEKATENYVIKIEPSENGPLFCEKTVYIRIGKKEDIKEYMKSKGLKSLGMPQFFGSGTHSLKGRKFRFLVMERFGKDLWSIFLEKKKIFPPATAFKIGIQILDVLEYIHSKGYVHADIKGANLLLGRNKVSENQVYLVDFGLAARYTSQFKPDPRRAHNGTIEYTSRDGHQGIVTRRGDIEILGYNILHWVSSNLPWESLKDVQEVQKEKNKYMEDVNALIRTCFKNKTANRAIEKYFNYLVNMEPLGEPDYDKLKQILNEGIARTGDVGIKLVFNLPSSKTKLNNSTSPVPAKTRKANDGIARTTRTGTSNKRTEKTITISDTNSSCSDEDIIESTPERKTKAKAKTKSWQDCPTVVSCNELPLRDDKGLRRTRRNK